MDETFKQLVEQIRLTVQAITDLDASIGGAGSVYVDPRIVQSHLTQKMALNKYLTGLVDNYNKLRQSVEAGAAEFNVNLVGAAQVMPVASEQVIIMPKEPKKQLE